MKFPLLFVFILLRCINIFSQKNENASLDKAGIFVDQRDGREYKTVRIGNQIWFAENFAYLPIIDFANLTVFGVIKNSVEDAKTSNSYKQYGALYSWEAAKNYAPKGGDYQLMPIGSS